MVPLKIKEKRSEIFLKHHFFSQMPTLNAKKLINFSFKILLGLVFSNTKYFTPLFVVRKVLWTISLWILDDVQFHLTFITEFLCRLSSEASTVEWIQKAWDIVSDLLIYRITEQYEADFV